MKAVIICPDRRTETAFLSRETPLALVPVLGPSVLEQWLMALADRGVKEVVVLAADRPDKVRAAVGEGERWGLKIKVCPEPVEVSPAVARERYPEVEVVVADHLPARLTAPLFESYAGFFAALKSRLPLAGKQRVGTREIAPGVWAGLRCKIDPAARVVAPCWLGENIWVRANSTIGPDAYIEDGAMVDNDAEITNSWLGPHTYAGTLTQMRNSLAYGTGLLNHANGSFMEIVDAFLMGDLQRGRGFVRSSPWYGRLAALLMLVLTSPVMLVAWVKNGGRQSLFLKKRAVVPTAVAGTKTLRELDYFELAGLVGKWRRWPQLWSIWRGHFTWIGNRPVTRSQAAQLETEFEQLWLAAPIGLFSLADTFGGVDDFDDDARAHASFYAVRGSGELDRKILRQMILCSSQKI